MKKLKRLVAGGVKRVKTGSYILRQLATHRKNSLFIKNLVVIMSMLAVLLFIYGVNFYMKIQENISQEQENSNLHILDRVEDMGTEVLKTAETISINVAIREYTRQYIITSDEKAREVYREEINDIINRYTSVYEYIDSIYVASLDGKRLSSGKVAEQPETYEDAEFLKGIDIKSDVQILSRKKRGIYPDLITIIRPITLDGSLLNSTPYGVVCVNLNAEKFGELLEKKDYKVNDIPGVIVVDGKGKILYSSGEGHIGKEAKNISYLKKVDSDVQNFTSREKDYGKSLIVSADKSDYKGMVFISIAEATDRREIFLQMLQYILEGMIFVVLASILAAGILAYTAYRPIVRISQVLDSDESITESLALRENSGEMKFIIENILNNMHRKTEMENEIKERVVILRKAMFTALQVQINPHFIYNTLENINWLAVKMEGRDNKVSSSILTLAKLMRYSLETEGYLVPIEDELSNARQYEELLKVRYPDTFEVVWNVSENVLKEKIIRLTLQPIIENAIQHGIRPKREKGLIEISCMMENDNICICVADDGVGMSEELMNEFNDSMAKEYLLESKHVGLRNVNQRLKIVFGESYGLRLSKRSDGKQGVAVILTIPALGAEYDDTNEMLLYGKKFI